METHVRGPQTPFEVYCYGCQSSFAVGTRRCVHCGGRLGSERMLPPAGTRPSIQDREIVEEELPTRGRFSPLTALWLVLALGAAAYRACTGG